MWHFIRHAARRFESWRLVAVVVALCFLEAELVSAQVPRPTRTPTPSKTPRGGITFTPSPTPSGPPTPVRTASRTPGLPSPTSSLRLPSPTPTVTLRGGVTATPSHTPTAGSPLPSLSPGAATLTPTATVTATPLPFGSPVSFRSAGQITVGPGLSSVAAGNLDRRSGSGQYLDVAVSQESEGSIRWLQGRGNGAFRIRPAILAAGNPRFVAVADLTGDGLADLVTANSDSGTVSLIVGRGDGTFVDAVQTDAAADPRGLVVADDVAAVMDGATNQVLLLRGDASPAITIVAAAPVPPDAAALASGDLDGDGLADVAVGHSGAGGVTMLRRLGDALSPVQTVATDGAVAAVAIGDVNQDGRSDLLVAREGGGFVVYLNTARQGFVRTFAAPTGLAPAGLLIADDRTPGFRVNGDGRPDAFVLDRGSNDIAVFHGLGDGRFEFSTRLVVGADPVGFALGNFCEDEEGAADIVTANAGDGTISVVRGSGGGSFQTALSFGTGPRPIAAVVGDFDRDGFPDLVTANEGDGTISFLRGNGRGSLRAHVDLAALPNPSALAAGDFDGNGWPDLVVSSAESAQTVILPNSIAGFGLPRPVDLGGPTDQLVSADLNGDGLDDLVARQTALNRVAFVFSQGTSFGAVESVEVSGTLTAMALARVVGDGNWDLVVGTDQPAGIAIYPGRGDHFGSPVRTSVPLAPNDLTVDDFLVDGIPDVAALSRGGQRIYILAGDGNGNLRRVEDFAAPPSAIGLVAADFNANGAADVATAVTDSSRVNVWEGTGLGQFRSNDFPVGRGPRALLVANLNVAADTTGGLAELVTVNTEANSVTVLRNITRATALPATPTATVGPDTPTPREPPSPIPTPTRRPRTSSGSSGCAVAGGSSLLPWLAAVWLVVFRRRWKRAS